MACTEPVIAAFAGLPLLGLCCGSRSLRVTPSAEVLPCVYWPRPAGHAEDLAADPKAILEGPVFQQLKHVPSACAGCEWLATCGGGCAGRRVLSGGLDRPDPYCPKRGTVRGPIEVHHAPPAERLHAGNVCTLLVQART
jgi:radical SAM protein with 4Fe4S-binding SPASM domain